MSDPSEARFPDDAETDEPTLFARARSGDAEAFGVLVERHRQRAFAMAYHILQNEHEALEVAQEAFVRAWRGVGKFRGASGFATWLFRIITNLSIDHLRRQKTRRTESLDETWAREDAEPASAPGRDDPRRELERTELRRRLGAALASLSPAHRAVLTLKEIDGLQYHEIAEAVGCSIGTVMSRLFHARRKMQTLLEDLHEQA